LSKQLQVARGSDEHEAAIARILKAAHDAGKKAAIYCTFTPSLFAVTNPVVVMLQAPGVAKV
jgi:hypothetical protein